MVRQQRDRPSRLHRRRADQPGRLRPHPLHVHPSLAGDANCYSSSTPTSEVHSAAGPGNHSFYLLAEGTSPTDGQPTSPTCNSTALSGVGIQNAATIMYNAMR